MEQSDRHKRYARRSRPKSPDRLQTVKVTGRSYVRFTNQGAGTHHVTSAPSLTERNKKEALHIGLFTLRGKLPAKTNTVLLIGGAIVFIAIWQAVIKIFNIPPEILPTPLAVVQAFPELHFENFLVQNTLYSLKLNILGYLEALAIALPFGFIIGLFPGPRGVFMGYVNALRFLPITALIGLFIIWFGIYSNMKIQFLTLGILVYLIPVVVQRIDNVDKVYDQCVITLGASTWQRIKSVFIPGTLAPLFDDVRVLIAISWTYIIIAEVVNMDQGGIGALAYRSGRQFRPDKVFACLLVILLIGFVQDQVMKWLDRQFFRHKYVKGDHS
ncbi:MAG: ABC transporter permease [Candidatus Brocadiia bacterium]|nr:MAG: ABC transporter permease [Candidatus Brocadiia bacterium]